MRALIAIVLLALVSSAARAPKQTDWQDYGLSGKVRVLIEEQISNDGEPFYRVTTHFSPDGFIEYEEVCEDPCETTRYVRENGWVKKTIATKSGRDDRRIVTYERNEKGEVTTETTEWEQGLTKRVDHFFDDSTQEDVVRETMNHNDPYELRTRRTPTGWVQKTVFADTEPLVSEITREELGDGVVRLTEKNPGGSVWITVRDREDRLVDLAQKWKDGFHRQTHKFDERGREIERAEWNEDGTFINRRSYTYIDDAQGNWTFMKEQFDSSALRQPMRPQIIQRRTISYY
jgi:hypothetical protein